MIDFHSHLNDERFKDDVDEVVKRAINEGLKIIVVAGYDIPSSEAAISLSSRFDMVYATVGLHPYEAENFTSREIEHIESLSKEKKVIGIGEIGLDYFRGPKNIEKQKELFRIQIEVARKSGKPVVLHVRDAFEDVFGEVIRSNDINFVFHSFSGGVKDMERIARYKHLFVSFSGMITFVKRVEDAAKVAPTDRTLVETDSPYLSPVPVRVRGTNLHMLSSY